MSEIPFLTVFSERRYLGCMDLQGITIGAKIITHTTFIVGKFISQLHTHISYTALIVEELFCVMRHLSLVSACLASMVSQKGNCTTEMLGELISNCTHTSCTSIIVGELIV